MKAIRYHDDARLEFLHEVKYYSAISKKKLGERFDKAIASTEQIAASVPSTGLNFRHGTPRVFPKRFPFAIVDQESDAEIFVLATAHFKRKPGYWHKRLK